MANSPRLSFPEAVEQIKREILKGDWNFDELRDLEREHRQQIAELKSKQEAQLDDREKHFRAISAVIWSNALEYFLDEVNVDILIDNHEPDGLSTRVCISIGSDETFEPIRKELTRRFRVKAEWGHNSTDEIGTPPEQELEQLVGKYRAFLRREFGLDESEAEAT